MTRVYRQERRIGTDDHCRESAQALGKVAPLRSVASQETHAKRSNVTLIMKTREPCEKTVPSNAIVGLEDICMVKPASMAHHAAVQHHVELIARGLQEAESSCWPRHMDISRLLFTLMMLLIALQQYISFTMSGMSMCIAMSPNTMLRIGLKLGDMLRGWQRCAPMKRCGCFRTTATCASTLIRFSLFAHSTHIARSLT